MSITSFFNGLWQNQQGEYIDILTGSTSKEIHVKSLAIGHAIDLIAKTISKSEIKVYRKDKNKKIIEKIDDVHYKLNISPNPNEQGTAFFYRVVEKLLTDQDALIIITESKNLYVADSFETSEDIMQAKTFSNIKISDLKNNSIKIEKTFNSQDVIYLTLGDSKIKKCINNFYTEYSKLLQAAAQSYKSSNTRKWKLKIPGSQPTMLDPITKKIITYDEYKKKITEGLLDEDKESVIMLSGDFDLLMMDKGTSQTSEDYNKMVKKVNDDIAMSFNIPLDVYYGSKTEKSTGTNDFITFAVSPILEILEDGINSKLIEKKDYIDGERIKINKFNMKHFDIMDVAGSLDKLTGIGFSHNDNRGFLGLPLIDENWANKHHITKNYANVEGGDNIG